MHTSMIMAVNPPSVAQRNVANLPATYSSPYDDYDVIQRVGDPEPQTPSERTKKDKKWFFGKLFRRKKKEDGSSSTESDDDSSSRASKRKIKKKKRTPTTLNNFDHIVVSDSRRAQSLMKTNSKEYIDDGVLSDPSASYSNYQFLSPYRSKESKENISSREKVYLEVPNKKTKKGRLKARVEAIRNSIKGDSSSDEGSLKSSGSSIMKFRSDDSLMPSRDCTLYKRSRNARNERYIKRLSRDDENQLNKEAELLQQGYTKAEVEMLTRTPTSQSSGYGTCKRQDNVYANENHASKPLKSGSISSFPSAQSYPSSVNFNARVNNEQLSYSIQYPNMSINKEPSYVNNNRQWIVTDHYDTQNAENVMCVKFPLGNVTNMSHDIKAAPVPPPRDMHRKLTTPVPMYTENSNFDRNDHPHKSFHGVPNNDFQRIMRRSQERQNLRRPISTSEDHIAMQNVTFRNTNFVTDQPQRPASVSAEPNYYGLYANTPPWRKKTSFIKPVPLQQKQDFLYYADESPRSRRPISIKSSQNGLSNNILSESQISLPHSENLHRRPKNASDFWKQLDDQERLRKSRNAFSNSRSNSESLYENQLNRHSVVLDRNVPNSVQRHYNYKDMEKINFQKSNSISYDTTDNAKIWKAATERTPTSEPLKPIDSNKSQRCHSHLMSKNDEATSEDEKTTEGRKSTNLDDALNELEAIYNSLGLGDEDLLDRAERRELMTPKFNENFGDWNGNNEEFRLQGQPTPALRRSARKSPVPDKVQDDMAYRRLHNSEKHTKSRNGGQNQISYMLASPVYVPYASDEDRYSDRNEPDIIYDDVVYRNIKQANSRLKTVEPQPPFGIPVGPVSPAPQSDYLHAMPENKGRPRFLPRISPDIVSDDLAYRSLRKDNNYRHSSILNGEEIKPQFKNLHNYNNLYLEPTESLKKKRAVRSLSANIFSMIQKEIDDALNINNDKSIQKTSSNSEITKKMRDVFENNQTQTDHYPRNKVKQRHNTVQIIGDQSQLSHNTLKDDSFIHKSSKPPSSDKSKCSSPSNRSPLPNRSSRDQFQHVLSMLAQEAMDTSNKLGVALAELDKNKSKSDIQSKISDSRLNFLNGLTNNKSADESFNLPQVKHVNVHSEVINVSQESHNTNNIYSKAKNTEDSLLEISQQLHKVEDCLKHSIEKELCVEDESSSIKTPSLNLSETRKASVSTVPPNQTFEHNVNQHPIRNDSIQVIVPEVNNCQRKTFNNENNLKTKEINQMHAFNELKEGISDLIAGISEVSDKLSISKLSNINDLNQEKKQIYNEPNVDDKSKNAINNVDRSLQEKDSDNLSLYENAEIKRETENVDYNSSEELANIFKTENKPSTSTQDPEISENVRTDLSSPKLVQSINQQLRKLSRDNTDNTECGTSQSNSLPNNIVAWRTKRQNLSQNDQNRDDSQCKDDWQSPSTLMLACSYTLMLTQHFADMDWLTMLGLMLAMITIIAMLLL